MNFGRMTMKTSSGRQRQQCTNTRRMRPHHFVVSSLLVLLSLIQSTNSFVPTFKIPSSTSTITSKASRIQQHQGQRQQRHDTVVSLQQRQTTGRDSKTKLYSLQPFIDNVIETASNRKPGDKPQTIFVGGKGGVGKTTVSSSLAVHLASLIAEDLNVLIVSTDPAHSLGDALDVDLRTASSRGSSSNNENVVTLTDPLTGGRLSAMEIDAELALQDFRDSLSAFDIDKLANSIGVNTELLEGLGLREFTGLLNNPPPGLDEIVALGNVFNSKGSDGNEYDVVIVDTAPTGHTLRLLSLPQFLTGFLSKLLSLRKKLSGIAATLQGFLGGGEQARQRTETIDNALSKLQDFQQRISSLQAQLTDKKQTEFIVVTVPTKLAISESKRLVTELQSQDIAVNHIVVNQCIINEDATGEDALANYYSRRRAGQTNWIAKLKEAADDVSSSQEYKSNGKDAKPITVTEFPFFDVELVGVPALGYVGSQHIVGNPNFDHLLQSGGGDDEVDGQPKVVICGGKGGVGKTTTSASLAVSMAAQGHKVALISTDPAHSLGDAIDMNLQGGKLIECPLLGVPTANIGVEGSLSVLEVDPTAALGQFKGVVDQLIGGGGGDDGGSSQESEIRSTLRELEQVFDTLPAGTDEVVALAQVVNLVKKGGFDRIVLDTAPTGHTLRMLSTPAFLADLIDRLLMIAQKVNSNAAVKILIASAAKGKTEQVESTGATAKSQLLSFQLQMFDLEDMFANPDQTEFLIVTVPTELAVRESVRLLNDLTFEAPDMPIKVRNIVINQVLTEDGADVETFLSHIRDGQATSIQDLEQAMERLGSVDKPQITKVPYLDTEPRGVYGLKVLADQLM